MPIRAVVFDFGGVMITPITNKLATLAERHGVTGAAMLEIMMGPKDRSTDHPWHRLERGEVAVEDVQDLLVPVADELGVSLRGDEMATLFDQGTHAANDAVIDAIGSLRRRGYRTALLTNVNAEYMPTMGTDFDLDGLFSVQVVSAHEGTRKPEERIYERTEELLGVGGNEIVYLDDFDANLVPAAARGWTVIHVTDPAAALAELDRVLDVSGS